VPSVHLEDHRADVHSQFGEDGMIREALRLIPDVPTRCVEFGAWDGRYKSNTRRLIVEDDWSAVLIEADPARFGELERTYAQSPGVTCVQGRVERTGRARWTRCWRAPSAPGSSASSRSTSTGTTGISGRRWSTTSQRS
jgi:hypothetical protein